MRARRFKVADWSRVATSYDCSGGELMRRDFIPSLGLCVLLLAPPAGAQILKCVDAEKNVTYSDVPCLRTEKSGRRRHPSQLERGGPQFHQSTKRPSVCACSGSSGLFRAACPATARTGTIHRRSFGKARNRLLAATESIARQRGIAHRPPAKRRCGFIGTNCGKYSLCSRELLGAVRRLGFPCVYQLRLVADRLS